MVTFFDLMLSDYEVHGFFFATERLWNMVNRKQMQQWEAEWWWNRLHNHTKQIG